MNRIRVALFTNRAAAEIIRCRLVQVGIAAECQNEPLVAKLWFVSKTAAGVYLEVPADDSERSTRLLSGWDPRLEAMGDAIRCPECKSLRVDYPQFTEKSLLTNLAIGLIAELRLVKREYYCEECHFMWAKPSIKHRPPRPHMAPDYFLERF
jgi:hypothetical protein